MPSAPVDPILMLFEGEGSLAGLDRVGAITATGSGPVRYQPSPGARINYFRDPKGIGGSFWAADGGSATYNGNIPDAEFGNCAEISASAANHGGTTLTGINDASMVIVPAGSIRISFDAKLMSGASDWKANITYSPDTVSASTGLITNAPVTFSPTRQRFSFVMTTPVACWIRVYLSRISAAASTIRVSNFVCEVDTGSDLGYFPPVWLDPKTGYPGTPNASPSVSKAGFWLAESTTNLFANPSLETNSTGFSPESAGATISRDTTRSYFGAASLKVVASGAGAYQGCFFTSAAVLAGSLTWSLWVYGAAGDPYRMAVVDGVSPTFEKFGTLSVTGWQRLSFSWTNATTGATCYFDGGVTPHAFTWYTDGWQLEQKPYATPYCDGSLGTGHTWTGTANASTSTRAGVGIDTPSSPPILPAEGAIAFKLRPNSAPGTLRYMALIGQLTASTDIVYFGIDNTNHFFMQWNSNNLGWFTITHPDVLAIGIEYTVYLSWDGPHQFIKINNGDVQHASRNVPAGSFGAHPQLTLWNSAGDHQIGSVAIYDEHLTDFLQTTIDNSVGARFETATGPETTAVLAAVQAGQPIPSGFAVNFAWADPVARYVVE